MPAPKLERSGMREKAGDDLPSGLEFRLQPGLDWVLLIPEAEQVLVGLRAPSRRPPPGRLSSERHRAASSAAAADADDEGDDADALLESSPEE